MAIEKIDHDLCNGCGSCEMFCPADVIRMDNESRKAIVKYPEDCILCLWCAVECPQNAIDLTPVNFSRLLTSWG